LDVMIARSCKAGIEPFLTVPSYSTYSDASHFDSERHLLHSCSTANGERKDKQSAGRHMCLSNCKVGYEQRQVYNGKGGEKRICFALQRP